MSEPRCKPPTELRLSDEHDVIEPVRTPSPAKPPLIVDLDGTLITTDMLHEGAISLLARRPLAAFQATIKLLFAGRAAIKSEIAAHNLVNIDTIPVRDDFLHWLEREAQSGRDLHLVSASDQSVVDRVARRFGLFKTAVGSDGVTNRKGAEKAIYLERNFPGGFSYAADSAADLPVWQKSQSIILVGTSRSVTDRAQALNKPIEAQFPNLSGRWQALAKQMRFHQWSKNLLVFVPMFLAHRFMDVYALTHTVLAFLALGLTASGTYILNDLIDLRADRSHATKRRRPIASGALPIARACSLVPLLLLSGAGMAAVAGENALLVLMGYLALTLAYSFRLKRAALLDTGVVGLLFTVRIILGCAAADIPPSPWLLAFSIMLFFSLSMAKRQTEITKKMRETTAQEIGGRGYNVSDGALTLVYGVSSGVASLVILMLYTTNDAAKGLYHNPNWLWAVPLLIYFWQMRIWLLAHRGELDDDPIVFALKDNISLLLGAGCAVAFYMAL